MGTDLWLFPKIGFLLKIELNWISAATAGPTCALSQLTGRPHLCQIVLPCKGKLFQRRNSSQSTKATQCLDFWLVVSKSILLKLWGKEIKPRRPFLNTSHGVLPRLASAAFECSRALICNLEKSNWSTFLESFSGTCSRLMSCCFFLPFCDSYGIDEVFWNCFKMTVPTLISALNSSLYSLQVYVHMKNQFRSQVSFCLVGSWCILVGNEHQGSRRKWAAPNGEAASGAVRATQYPEG